MQTTNKLNRDGRYTDAHRGDVGIESMGVLPVALYGATPDRFIVTHRLSVNHRTVKSEIELTREQVVWLRDHLTDVLNETDPAYIAHMEKAAALGESQPATDEEYQAHLAEGCKS